MTSLAYQSGNATIIAACLSGLALVSALTRSLPRSGPAAWARSTELFQTRAVSTTFAFSPYDVTADGRRFLINTALEAEGAAAVTVVMNWK